jgi:hypothetical protein
LRSTRHRNVVNEKLPSAVPVAAARGLPPGTAALVVATSRAHVGIAAGFWSVSPLTGESASALEARGGLAWPRARKARYVHLASAPRGKKRTRRAGHAGGVRIAGACAKRMRTPLTHTPPLKPLATPRR